jgi:hypothetical protein
MPATVTVPDAGVSSIVSWTSVEDDFPAERRISARSRATIS